MATSKKIIYFFVPLAVTLAFSLWSPGGSITATPKYWWDEGFSLEIARTFLETHQFDVTVAPHTTSGIGIALNANGIPLTFPLAIFFKLFGVGLLQARIYMILWILATIALLYLFLEDILDRDAALAGTLLVATFASFYANGRTATGDIPGFFFLILGLWVLIKKDMYVWSGVLLGISAITKPSVYITVLPSIVLALFIAKRTQSIAKILRVALGSILSAIVWFLIILPRPYHLADIWPGLRFFLHTYEKPSLLERLPGSIPEILFSSTMLYFFAIFFLILFAYRKGAFQTSNLFVLFSLSYAVLQFGKFFTSPGWVRYLIGVELIGLMCLFPALRTLVSTYSKHGVRTAYYCLAALLVVQSAQYMFFSNIFSNPDSTRLADALNTILAHDPASTVGLVNNPTTSALIPGDRKYHLLKAGKDTVAGEHPLNTSPDKFPTYMASDEGGYDSVIEHYYEPMRIENGITIYKKKSTSQ